MSLNDRIAAAVDSVFEFSRPVTNADRLHFRALEVFVCFAACWASWKWAFNFPREEVFYPAFLGIAEFTGAPFVSISAAYAVAAFITGFAVYAYAGRRPAVGYSLVFVLMHLLYVSRWVYGKPAHSDNMLGVTLLGLAAGAALFSSDEAHRIRGSLGLIFISVGLIYVLAGLAKLRTTGLGWANGLNLQIWIYESRIGEFAAHGNLEFSALQRFFLEHTTAGTVALAGALMTECAGFLVWFVRVRYLVLAAILAMHVGIWWVLDIRFTFFMIEVVILAVPVLWRTRKEAFA